MLRSTINARWLTALFVAIAIAAGGLMTVAAQTASAAACEVTITLKAQQPGCYPTYHTVDANYTGWTYLNLNYCPPGMACAAVVRPPATAWSWTGYAWRQTTLPQGWVYVQPYSGQWHWAYSYQTQRWVAVHHSVGRFELR